MSRDQSVEILNEMKSIFSGCDSTIDAIHMSEYLFSKYPQHKQLIVSYRDSLPYPDHIDLMTKIVSLESVSNAPSKDDALNLKNTLSSRSSDIIYLKTLERIVSRKRNKSYTHDTYNTQYHHIPTVIKNCPHCDEPMKMTEDTTYVICGYPKNKGYDWNGCCCDWCFSCGKMLCKTWENDDLNVEENRYHDDSCCKAHSKRNGYTYPTDYCQCVQNQYVSRKEYTYGI